MELRKTNESVNRSFSAEGEASERIDNASYEILDKDGTVIGNANIGNGYGNANISISGFASIKEGEDRLRETLGIN